MPSETAKASLGYVTSYGAAKRGGYQGSYEEWCALMAEVADHLEQNIQLNEDSQAAKAMAVLAEQEAETAALNAEAWAKGTKAGSSVPSTDPEYHDNAKYYSEVAGDQKDQAEQAASSAAGSAETAEGYSTDAEAWAAGTRGGEEVESGDDAYQNNAKYFSEQSSGSATEAAVSAETAEGWATGGSGGTAGAQNNAKYYSQQAAASAQTAAAMGTNFAPEFSSSTSYSAGDYVLYQGTLYRFTADHAAGAWVGTDAAAEKIAPVVSDLKTQLNDLLGVSEITFQSKKYVNGTGNTIAMSDGAPVVETTNNFNCAVIECVAGDKFIVSGTGGSSARLWLFADSAGNILNKSASNSTESQLVLTAPYGAAWCIVCNSVSSSAKSFTGQTVPSVAAEEKADMAVINDTLYETYNASNDFELGVINTNGTLDGSTKRVRSSKYIRVSDVISIVNDQTTSYSLRFYASDYSFITYANWMTASLYDLSAVAPLNCKYIKVVGKYVSDTSISDVSAIAALIVITAKKSKIEINEEDIATINAMLNDTGVINLGFKTGNINNTTGNEEWNNTTRVKSHVYIPADSIKAITVANNAQYSLRYYDADKNYLSGMNTWATESATDIASLLPSGCKYIRITGRYKNDPTIDDILAFSRDLTVTCEQSVIDNICKNFVYPENNKIFTGNVGNMSIVCAKEHTNDSGNNSVIEWYLLEEAGGTNRFFISKDLCHKEFAFMFTGNAYMYSFGVLANGDIIAVLDASSISWDDDGNVERSESFRKNPYVFLAAENWSIQHEVDFGENIAPLGWLSNYGFRVLPNGTALFAEYTRYCVLTANVWKINGDPTDDENWTVVKQLELPAPNQNLLKHWHTVQYDPFTGVVYAATGDSNSGSFCFYSTDNGDTWTQLEVNGVGYSSKYFRFLNLIFTEDLIYWAKDWYDSEHYLFKCGRDANGVMDIANVVDYIAIPEVENLSTYTTCYLPEIDAILLLEREDSGGGTNAPAPIRLCDLANGTLHTIAYMTSAKGVREQIGFRTRYSEVYPHQCIINIGWALRRQLNANAVNLLDWYDNAGNDESPYKYGLDNVNNLWLEAYKNNSGYHLKIGTRLI